MTQNNREVIILIAEDDDGHARLIEKNLTRASLNNQIHRFHNGQAVLDFLFGGEMVHTVPRTRLISCCWIFACPRWMA
jgi:hypothetical protein